MVPLTKQMCHLSTMQVSFKRVVQALSPIKSDNSCAKATVWRPSKYRAHVLLVRRRDVHDTYCLVCGSISSRLMTDQTAPLNTYRITGNGLVSLQSVMRPVLPTCMLELCIYPVSCVYTVHILPSNREVRNNLTLWGQNYKKVSPHMADVFLGQIHSKLKEGWNPQQK